MKFGFALDLPDIYLLNIDLLDQRYTHLDFLDKGIPSKHFVYFQDVFKICFQDVFKRFLQDVLKTSWKTKSFHAKDVLKKSSRHVLNTSSRRLQDQQVFFGSLYNRRELETKIDKWTKVSILKKEMKSNSVQFVMSHTVLTETSLRKFPVGLKYKWLEQDLNSRPLSS